MCTVEDVFSGMWMLGCELLLCFPEWSTFPGAPGPELLLYKALFGG